MPGILPIIVRFLPFSPRLPGEESSRKRDKKGSPALPGEPHPGPKTSLSPGCSSWTPTSPRAACSQQCTAVVHPGRCREEVHQGSVQAPPGYTRVHHRDTAGQECHRGSRMSPWVKNTRYQAQGSPILPRKTPTLPRVTSRFFKKVAKSDVILTLLLVWSGPAFCPNSS